MMASKSLELGPDEQQTWRSHWLACCGTCTPIDCLSCCTAYFAPCVAYGWTTSRVFRTSFWREMYKYVLVFGLIIFINTSFEGARQAACAVPAGHQASTGAPPMKPTATCTAMSGALDDVVLWVSVGCAVVWAVYIGGPRRTQLRRLLGIADRGAGGDCCTCCYSSPNKGSGSDCCLHYWCLCCALAQEMRTVMHLKADNKLPGVSPEGYEPLLTKAPVFNGGMTRVEGAPVASMV